MQIRRILFPPPRSSMEVKSRFGMPSHEREIRQGKTSDWRPLCCSFHVVARLLASRGEDILSERKRIGTRGKRMRLKVSWNQNQMRCIPCHGPDAEKSNSQIETSYESDLILSRCVDSILLALVCLCLQLSVYVGYLLVRSYDDEAHLERVLEEQLLEYGQSARYKSHQVQAAIILRLYALKRSYLYPIKHLLRPVKAWCYRYRLSTSPWTIWISQYTRLNVLDILHPLYTNDKALY